ncbi:MAG: hypothetical protein WD599_04590, partial [Balneolaceae bacterium]
MTYNSIFDETVPFDEKFRRVFQYQVRYNPVYTRFCRIFGYHEHRIPEPDRVPLIPVRAFKEARLIPETMSASIVFRSSGTTDENRSRHLIADPEIYRQSLRRGFDRFYSPDAIIWAYTPGYQQNPDSSLV